MLDRFSKDVGTQYVRDDWDATDSAASPDTNKIRFSKWVDSDSTTPYVFQTSRTGFGPPVAIPGYDGNRKMDQKACTTVLLTPDLTETARIYGRIGNSTYWTNWFRIVVRDYAATRESDDTKSFCFVQDSSVGITLAGDAYNKDEETIARHFNGIQLPRAIAQIYIEKFYGELHIGDGATVYTGDGAYCD